jgi:predicted nucleic acid-binding protein
VAALIREATLIDVTIQIVACRDPNDDQLLALAVAGQATCIITGDADLLQLHPFQEIPILSPDAFLSALDAPDTSAAIDEALSANNS